MKSRHFWKNAIIIVVAFACLIYADNLIYLPKLDSNQSIKWDGLINEAAWGDSLLFISPQNYTVRGTCTPNDVEITLWMRWNDSTLYVSWRIVDDVYRSYSADKLNLYLSVVYATSASDSARPFFGPYGKQIAAEWNPASSSPGLFYAAEDVPYGPSDNLDSVGVTVFVDYTTFEAKMDWNKLFHKVPHLGDTLGANFFYSDVDSNGADDCQIAWTKTTVTFPNSWGKVILTGVSTNPSVTENKTNAFLPTTLKVTALTGNNMSTKFSLSLPTPGPVNLKGYDIHGRLVWSTCRSLPAGNSQIVWNSNLPKGVYFVRAVLNGNVANVRFLRMR
jgi:hypothetical protein